MPRLLEGGKILRMLISCIFARYSVRFVLGPSSFALIKQFVRLGILRSRCKRAEYDHCSAIETDVLGRKQKSEEGVKESFKRQTCVLALIQPGETFQPISQGLPQKVTIFTKVEEKQVETWERSPHLELRFRSDPSSDPAQRPAMCRQY